MAINKIRVLVVDDSAFARRVIREVLAAQTDIEVVGIARDGLEALEKIAELKPDVMTLDLSMPNLDGLGVLRALPKLDGPRVVLVSISGANTEIALEGLRLGAVDLVEKPTALPTDRLYDLNADLILKVRAAAAAIARAPVERRVQQPVLEFSAPTSPTEIRLVVIGTSTGGPQALANFFSAVPAGLPVSFAIAQHIPAGYTGPLAARLTSLGGVPIVEATDGMELLPGAGVIAPGGMHLCLRRDGQRIFAVVSRDPYDTPHHPSVNVLFKSAARELGSKVLGVIMTGMGDDGLEGARAIVSAGGRMIAESASSCIVYGMPRVVIEAGLAQAEAPIEKLPQAMMSVLFGSPARL